MSGVYSLRGQLSIRGSGGFTLNAGSRALMLLDGLPLLSADAAEVHWKLLPTEQLEQIEVLKTAGSALYGSSALGGVVHFRTRKPGMEPLNMISGFTGVYANPPLFIATHGVVPTTQHSTDYPTCTVLGTAAPKSPEASKPLQIKVFALAKRANDSAVA